LKKPTLEEVLLYAEKQIKIFVAKFGNNVPREHRQEMAQVARLRIFEAYERIDHRGWKSFTQQHCRGAILDYLRWGDGFQERRLEKKRDVPLEAVKKGLRLRSRIQIVTDSGNDLSLEAVLGMFGVFAKDDSRLLNTNWELVARMARVDADIHLVAKLLLGFTQTELSSMFMVSRERLTQRLQDFCIGLDSPNKYYSNWIAQKIFAFGLSKYFHQEERDLGFGWEYDPVDLDSNDINYIASIAPQLYFKFDIN